MKNFIYVIVAIVLLAPGRAGAADLDDPLPAWNNGRSKKAIVDFVHAVTERGGRDFVPLEDRVATFDNDGTLWCEKPTIEVVFGLEQFERFLPRHPEWKEQQPFQAILAKDKAHLAHLDIKEMLHFFVATHGDISQPAFRADARKFFATAKHPRFGVLYKEVTFTPMVELVKFLHKNGFRVYICSGGDADTMRTVSQEIYGVPVENVIGTSYVFDAREVNGKLILFRTTKILSINDKLDKPKNIWLHVGKRPIFAAGNVRSGGDIAMLRFSQGSTYRSLQLMVNHDDAEREFAYAEPDNASLDAAKRHGWHVVSMKSDWNRIFSFK